MRRKRTPLERESCLRQHPIEAVGQSAGRRGRARRPRPENAVVRPIFCVRHRKPVRGGTHGARRRDRVVYAARIDVAEKGEREMDRFLTRRAPAGLARERLRPLRKFRRRALGRPEREEGANARDGGFGCAQTRYLRVSAASA